MRSLILCLVLGFLVELAPQHAQRLGHAPQAAPSEAPSATPAAAGLDVAMVQRGGRGSSSRPAPRPAPRPSAGRSRGSSPRPSARPTSRPSPSRPSARPAPRPAPRPTARPAPRPAPRPTARPTASGSRSSARPASDGRAGRDLRPAPRGRSTPSRVDGPRYVPTDAASPTSAPRSIEPRSYAPAGADDRGAPAGSPVSGSPATGFPASGSSAAGPPRDGASILDARASSSRRVRFPAPYRPAGGAGVRTDTDRFGPASPGGRSEPGSLRGSRSLAEHYRGAPRSTRPSAGSKTAGTGSLVDGRGPRGSRGTEGRGDAPGAGPDRGPGRGSDRGPGQGERSLGPVDIGARTYGQGPRGRLVRESKPGRGDGGPSRPTLGTPGSRGSGPSSADAGRGSRAGDDYGRTLDRLARRRKVDPPTGDAVDAAGRAISAGQYAGISTAVRAAGGIVPGDYWGRGGYAPPGAGCNYGWNDCYYPWGFGYCGGGFRFGFSFGWSSWGCWYPAYLSCWYPYWYWYYRPLYWSYPAYYSTVVYRTVYEDSYVPEQPVQEVVADPVGEAVVAQPLAPREGNPNSLRIAAERYLTLGDRAFREGRYTEAVQFYAKAVQFAPGEGALHFVLADALFAAGDYHYAAYSIRRGLELDPTIAETVTDKHDFYDDPSVFEHQLAVLERYLADHPTDRDARLVLATNRLLGGRPARVAELYEGAGRDALPGDFAAELVRDAAATRPAPFVDLYPEEEGAGR